MSRELPRWAIWYYHMGLTMRGKCMCCGSTDITYNALTDDVDEWHRGHIIPAKDTGPNIYENIHPICRRCNSNDRRHKTNYHYMVWLGRMSTADAKKKLEYIRYMAGLYLKKRSLLKCEAMVTSTKTKRQRRCRYNKKPGMKYCGHHGPDPEAMLQNLQEVEIAAGKLIERYPEDDSKDSDYVEGPEEELGSSEDFSEDDESDENNTIKREKQRQYEYQQEVKQRQDEYQKEQNREEQNRRQQNREEQERASKNDARTDNNALPSAAKIEKRVTRSMRAEDSRKIADRKRAEQKDEGRRTCDKCDTCDTLKSELNRARTKLTELERVMKDTKQSVSDRKEILCVVKGIDQVLDRLKAE